MIKNKISRRNRKRRMTAGFSLKSLKHKLQKAFHKKYHHDIYLNEHLQKMTSAITSGRPVQDSVLKNYDQQLRKINKEITAMEKKPWQDPNYGYLIDGRNYITRTRKTYQKTLRSMIDQTK